MYNILWNKWEKKTCVDLYFFLSTVHLQNSKIVTFGLISLFCPLCTSPVIWWNALEMWFINQTLSFYRFCSVFLKRIHGGIVARQWCSGCRWRFFFLITVIHSSIVEAHRRFYHLFVLFLRRQIIMATSTEYNQYISPQLKLVVFYMKVNNC